MVGVVSAGLTVSDSAPIPEIEPLLASETTPLGAPAVDRAAAVRYLAVAPTAASPRLLPARVPDSPPPAPAPSVTVPSPSVAVEQVTVVSGDTLSSIARKHEQTWQELWRRNLETVPDPDVLQVGQVLSLTAPLQEAPAPPAPEPAAADTAADTASDTADEAASEEAAPASSDVVAIARTFEGIPYRWGGKSRSGVDCSGLVYLVFKQAGITDSYRTSGSLREWTTPISRSEARAGDLVFGPGHVGIYAGNGMMIDAPRPGKSVGYRKVYSTMTSFGRVPS